MHKLSEAKQNYSESLRTTLASKGIWHRFIEFDKPVRTVEEAARKVSADRIIKSIVLVGSDKKPILAILPAKNRISYKKIKTLLKVKDVRLAQPDEVLEHSGYPVGGVPPFNKIIRILLDPTVQRNARSIAGGGDPDKLVELETKDILEFLDPIIADFSV
jgi:prolyl-tRNA editing enzyme YbaK/EbsC (Cys-tRNA(Pro) deacylase)